MSARLYPWQRPETAEEVVDAVRFKRPLVILPASLNFVHYMRYAWPVRYYDRVLLQYF